MQPNLHLELDKDRRICAELAARFPDISEDPEFLTDTLDGLSSLPEAIAATLRAGREDLVVAEALGKQIERLQARKARLVERADRRKALALWAMQESNRRRIDAPDFIAYITMGRSKVVIPDESAVPDEYMRIKKEPDRKKTGEDLRLGKDLSWASLSNPAPIIIVKDG
jgi:hypothetical protein